MRIHQFVLSFLILASPGLPQLLKSISCIDTSLCGINLDDHESTWRVLGKKVAIDQHNDDFPSYSFRNNAGTEVATVVFYPGGVVDEFSAFHVREAQSEDSVLIRKANIITIRSGRGITLGMSLQRVRKELCASHIVTKQEKDTTFLQYHVDDNSHNFEHFNMPSYSAIYKFVKDRLVGFTFGFDYP
jgi:hypothetical protein